MTALTPTERVVAAALLDGLSYKEMAQQTGLSLCAVKFHMNNIRRKLGRTTLPGCVAALYQLVVSRERVMEVVP